VCSVAFGGGPYRVAVVVWLSEVTVAVRARVWLSQREDGALIVHARGDIDTTTAGRLRWVVVDAADRAGPPGVMLDLSGVGFIDSVGLAALVAGFKAALATGVRLTVGEASPFAARLLQMTGLATAWELPEDAAGSDTGLGWQTEPGTSGPPTHARQATAADPMVPRTAATPPSAGSGPQPTGVDDPQVPATTEESRMGPGRHRMPPQLVVTPTTIDDTTVSICVDGELDTGTVGQLDQALHAVLTKAALTRVVLDFDSLEFISTGGIYALVAAHQTAQRRHIALSVVNCSVPVRKLLQTTGLLDDLTTAERTDNDA
jgi:anti-sigma B factor antagonist